MKLIDDNTDRKALIIVLLWGIFLGLGLSKGCDMLDRRLSIELKAPK